MSSFDSVQFTPQQAHHRYCCASCTESARFTHLCKSFAAQANLLCSPASGDGKRAHCTAAASMAYCCTPKAVLSGSRNAALANHLVSVRRSVLKTRAVDGVQRRPAVGQHTNRMPCKAVGEPATEKKQQVSDVEILRR